MNKILLIEDDPALGEVLKDHLEWNDYEVSLLRIPRNAVDSLLEDDFDLVIMDKLLAGVDGTQICKKIRNTEGISNTPILMMSGFDGAREICIAAGANNFIAKPFEVNSFLKSIGETIDKAKDFQE